MPQLGWHPHLNEPHSDSRPPRRSFKSENGPEADSGYQSRIGSPIFAWLFTSCARCESVYRCFVRVSSSMSSSRPVKETGWNATAVTLSMFSIPKRMMSPTWSLLMPLMIVTTSVTSTPCLWRFWIARSLTSYRLPTFRCWLFSFPTPSNWRYAKRSPASAACRANSGSCAKRMPLVAHCTEK